jgi:hypothetical protein
LIDLGETMPVVGLQSLNVMDMSNTDST